MRTEELCVVMGPSGCGKSTVAKALAAQTASAFIEADDYHSPENKAKMASGTPLSDADRVAWLDDLQAAIAQSPMPIVWLACSALTPYVQTRLRNMGRREVTFILLDVPQEALQDRLDKRTGHFMSPDLLDSQIGALDTPRDAVIVNADRPLEALTDEIRNALGKQREQ